LVQTERHKILSLTPEATKKRDLICILPGCSVPVVLREHRHEIERNAEHPEGVKKSFCKFIGESYVHGMMDGEAFEIKKQDKIEYQWFHIT
jgi:hypothetical protein